MIDDRLSLALTRPDGYVKRWGPDSPDGADVPNDLTFSDTIPGGHATLGTNLLRRIDVQHADEGLFDDVHCYGAGGRTAWRGLWQQFPRTHGDGFGVSPGAVGWSAALRWDPSFTEVYIDRDVSHWEQPGLTRRAALATAAQSIGEFATGEGGLMLTARGAWATVSGIRAEAYYRAPAGRTIARVALGWATNSNVGTDATFLLQAYSTTDQVTFPENSADVLTGSTAGVLNFTPTTPRQYVMVQLAYPSAAGGAGLEYAVTLSNPYVLGDHGITDRGTSSATGGVWGSDVIAHIVSQAAPMLTYTTGAGGSIDPTTFIIGHLVYRDPITAEQAISDVNKYHLYDWGVYDDREFFFRQPDPDRLLWEARLSDGAHLDADGDTAEQVINGVFVSYTDPTGVPMTVGPPGGSFDDTDTLLADTSSSNPVNAHGIPRKWVQLNLSFPARLSDAVQIGYVYLQERSLAGRRGRVTLTGTATHPTEGKVPCWRVRAGDWISLKDLNGATVPRKIISKSYSHGSRQVVLDLDNTPAAMDAILARVGIQAGIATGGGF